MVLQTGSVFFLVVPCCWFFFVPNGFLWSKMEFICQENEEPCSENVVVEAQKDVVVEAQKDVVVEKDVEKSVSSASSVASEETMKQSEDQTEEQKEVLRNKLFEVESLKPSLRRLFEDKLTSFDALFDKVFQEGISPMLTCGKKWTPEYIGNHYHVARKKVVTGENMEMFETMCFTGFTYIASHFSSNRDLMTSSIADFVKSHQKYTDIAASCDEVELASMHKFWVYIRLLRTILSPQQKKGLFLQVAHRFERGEKCVTGGGESLRVNRRVIIFETETGVIKQPRKPRSKRTNTKAEDIPDQFEESDDSQSAAKKPRTAENDILVHAKANIDPLFFGMNDANKRSAPTTIFSPPPVVAAASIPIPSPSPPADGQVYGNLAYGPQLTMKFPNNSVVQIPYQLMHSLMPSFALVEALSRKNEVEV